MGTAKADSQAIQETSQPELSEKGELFYHGVALTKLVQLRNCLTLLILTVSLDSLVECSQI